MWPILFWIVGGLLCLLILINIIGLFLPKEHTATRVVTHSAAAEEVSRLIRTFEDHADWRPEVREVRARADQSGREIWQIIGRKGDRLSLVIEEDDPPRRMVTRIVDNRMFGGTWTWEVVPIDDRSCTLSITEDGEIYIPAFRIFAHLADLRGTMDGVHRAIAAKFGYDIRLSD